MTQVNLTKDLSAYYTFDDADIDNSRDMVQDRSGHGLTATVHGGITYGVDSPVGESVSFPSDSGAIVASDSYEHPRLNVVTVSAVIRPDEKASRLMSMGSAGDAFREFRMTDDLLQVGNDELSDTVTASYSAPEDEWSHVVGRFDLNGSADAFLNGEHVDSEVVPDNWEEEHLESRIQNEPWYVGDRPNFGWLDGDDDTNNWHGEIASYRLYHRKLSDIEIQLLANQTGRMVSSL